MAYPGTVDSFSTKADGVDTVAAAHVNALQTAVVAVETELGTNPKGSAASVGARIGAAETSLTAKLDATTAASTYLTQSAATATYASIASTDLGYDVFVLMGQSNMVGNGTTIATSYTDPTNDRLWRWVTSGNGTAALASYKSLITLASDPLGHPDTLSGVGPGMEFGRWYTQMLSENRRVLIVPCAVSATPLVTTTPPTWNSTVSSSLLDQAIAYANAAIAAAGANARLKGFLWVQGETDSQNSVSAASYQAALDALITKVRAQVTGATSSTPFVIGSMVPSWVATPVGTSVSIAAIHTGTPARVTYTGYAAGPTGSGNIHYTEAEARTLGRSMLTAYLSALTNVPTPVVPGAPTGLTATGGNTQVALSWTAPTTGYPALTDYLIEVSTNGGTSWSTVTDGVSTATSYTHTGLTNGTTYTYRVSGINATGTGTASGTASATPSAATVPGAPTGVSGTFGNAQVSLTWSAPASNGGSAITDYVVQYSSDSGSTWTTFADGTSTATAATVTGLTNGTAYVFHVAAVNAIGQGAYSSTSSPVTPSSALVLDTFNRADSGTLGNADTGQTWAVTSPGSGTYAISSNKCVPGTQVDQTIALINAGTATQTVSADFPGRPDGAGQYGIIARATDANNCYITTVRANGTVDLYKRVAGAITSIGSSSVGAFPASAATFSIQVSGTSITVKAAGTTVVSVTDSAISTGNLAGMYQGPAPTTASTRSWDNFTVV